jgi:hypothetical protein
MILRLDNLSMQLSVQRIGSRLADDRDRADAAGVYLRQFYAERGEVLGGFAHMTGVCCSEKVLGKVRSAFASAMRRQHIDQP